MIHPIRRIVVGAATLAEPEPVLAEAVALARRHGAVLHVVHSFELPDPMWSAYARMGYVGADALWEYTAGVHQRIAECVFEIDPGARLRCHAVAGPAAAAINETASKVEASLIAVGATRRGTLGRTILGTTAQRVLRSASVPVLVVRRRQADRLQRVLLTTDLSAFSAGIHEAGLDVLESLFAGESPELRSLLVLRYGFELPPPLRKELLTDAAERELSAFLAERRERTAPVAGVLRYGEPAKEIVAEAAEWGADLLVMGTHGRTTAQRWLLGSVAEAAIRSTRTNVLVIPARIEEQRRLPVAAEPFSNPTAGPSDP